MSMAQYIHVYMDDEKNNYKNKGLYEIIVFIGEKSYRGKKDVTIEEAYKRGKRIINAKLNKWHLSTIERLVRADRKKYLLNYDQRTPRALWKIHRKKAGKVFKVIRLILKKYDNDEVRVLFNNICKVYGFSTGDEATGSPYYRVISNNHMLICQDYDNKDITDLEKCSNKIRSFSEFH